MSLPAIPEDFKYLSMCFHQDIMHFVSTEEEFVAHGLKFLQPSQKTVVEQFLTEVLKMNPDIEELQAIWESTGPNWGFEGEGLRIFLTMIRDQIETVSQ